MAKSQIYCSDHLKSEVEFGIRVCFFIFASHAKLGTTNNHRTGFSDICGTKKFSAKHFRKKKKKFFHFY